MTVSHLENEIKRIVAEYDLENEVKVIVVKNDFLSKLEDRENGRR